MRRRDFIQIGRRPGRRENLAGAAARKKIAALSTTYHVRSHSDNFITRFLEGYWIDKRYYASPADIVSLYMDQVHPADIGHRLSTAYNFPVTKSIADALTLGTGKLSVDGVLLVAEHGDYPFNDKQQQLYPRYEFFEQVVQVFRKSGRAVPVFSDKHLSYDWTKARQMYDWSRELHFPFMAGSSLPVTFRRPELDYPLGVRFEDALMVGGGWTSDGGIFHNLETLQCFVERRAGGETGIRAVQHLEGEAVWRAAEEGRWSKDLMKAALSRGETVGPGRPEDVSKPVLCLLEYHDGFRAAILSLGGLVNEYLVAFRVKGRPAIDSTLCYIPIENSNNFSMLVHGIAQMFRRASLASRGAYVAHNGRAFVPDGIRHAGAQTAGNADAAGAVIRLRPHHSMRTGGGPNGLGTGGWTAPKIDKVAQGFGYTEGPVFSRHRLSSVQRRQGGPDPAMGRGYGQAFRENSNGANGLTFDHQGRLLACEQGRVTRTEKDGSITVLAAAFEGARLTSPNDLVYAIDGSIYFSVIQPRGERRSGQFGRVSDHAQRPTAGCHSGMHRPNGVALAAESAKAIHCRYRSTQCAGI